MSGRAYEMPDAALLDPRFRGSDPPRRVRYTRDTQRVRYGLLGGAVFALLAVQGVSSAATGKPWNAPFLVSAFLLAGVRGGVETYHRTRLRILREYAATVGLVSGHRAVGYGDSLVVVTFRYLPSADRRFDCTMRMLAEQAASFPEGAPLTVLYDPAEPASCLPAAVLDEAEFA